ncbi:hypothetical protein H9P43_007831 [Blastocladiella emersonii ATCC 22665]|nr:hypothetical protein H9P43_007831 [Blastocladiella emersonii ATCC 22665]
MAATPPLIQIRHEAARASGPLVSTPTLLFMGVAWAASLVAFPLLTWYGLLLPALGASFFAVAIPLGAGLVVSGFAIHSRVAHSLDAVVRLLLAISSLLTPVARRVAASPVLSTLVSGALKLQFFAWFTALVVVDRVMRRMFAKLVGRHGASSRHYSLVNAADPSFQPAGIFSDAVDAGLGLAPPAGAESGTTTTSDALLREQGIPFRPKTAYSLSMAAKLAYEDLAIIKHELEVAGYDMDTFAPIHYRNTCGFVVAKGRTVIVIFRGTKPLNAANIVTDIRHHMVPAAEPGSDVDLGNVHEGFLEALGPVEMGDDDDDPDLVPLDVGSPPIPADTYRRLGGGSKSGTGSSRRGPRTATGRASRITARGLPVPPSRVVRLELHMHSLTAALVSAVRALATVGDVVVRAIARHVSDPIERFTHIDNREESAYVQAHRGIAACLQKMRIQESLNGVVAAHARALRTRRPTASGFHATAAQLAAVEDELADVDDAASDLLAGGGLLYRAPSMAARKRMVRRSDSGAFERNVDGTSPLTSDVDLESESEAGVKRGNKDRGLFGRRSSSSSSSSESASDLSSDDDGEDEANQPIRLYIGGHSLGGAIAHVFLAKLTECDSSFLEYFDGLYTFGSPRVGDAGFESFLSGRHANLFRIVYNKDIVPRVPPLDPYAELPGHLVTLSPLGKMVFRPPGTVTRPVSFLSPSGLLSPTVIFQLRNESFLRFVYRVVLPFYVNDHMPSDYALALQKYAY